MPTSNLDSVLGSIGQEFSSILKSDNEIGIAPTQSRYGMQQFTPETLSSPSLADQGMEKTKMPSLGEMYKKANPVVDMAIHPIKSVEKLVDRAKGAVQGVVEGEKYLFGEGAKGVVEGGKDMYDAFASNDTFQSGKEYKSVPTPEGHDRDFTNRLQQLLLGLGHVAGGTGKIATGLVPATVMSEAALGIVKPELAQGAEWAKKNIWDVLPEHAKEAAIQSFKDTKLSPMNPLKIGDIVDAVKEEPVAFQDAVFSLSNMLWPGIARNAQKSVDAVKSKMGVGAKPEAGTKAKMTLDTNQRENAVKMRESDPERAKQMEENARAYSSDDLEVKKTAKPPMEDVANKVNAKKAELEAIQKDTGKQIGDAMKDMPKQQRYADPLTLRQKFIDKLDTEYGVTTSPDGALDFSSSKFRTNTGLQKTLQEQADWLSQKRSIVELQRNKQLIGDAIYQSTATTKDLTAGESLLNGIREDTKAFIAEKFPKLQELNDTFSKTQDALDDLKRVLGAEGDKATQYVRLISGANRAKYEPILSKMDDLLGTNLVNEAKFAADLENMTGISKPYELTGRLSSIPTSKVSVLKKGAEAIGNAVVGTPLDNVKNIISFARSSGKPALLQFADFLETDVTPYLEKAYGVAKGAIGAVVGDKSGSALMPTSALGGNPNPYNLPFKTTGEESVDDIAKRLKDEFGWSKKQITAKVTEIATGNPVSDGMEAVDGIPAGDLKTGGSFPQADPTASPKGDTVTLYHASPKMPTKGNWKKGTYFATDEQNARYYSESHHADDVADITVKKVEIPKNLLQEQGGNRFVLKEEYPITQSASPKAIPDSLAKEARKYGSAEEFVKNIQPGSEITKDYIKLPSGGRISFEEGKNNITIFGVKDAEAMPLGKGTGEPTKAVRSLMAYAANNGKTITVKGISNVPYWKYLGFDDIIDFKAVLSPDKILNTWRVNQLSDFLNKIIK